MTTSRHDDARMSYMLERYMEHLAGASERTRQDRQRLLLQLHDVLPLGLLSGTTETIEAFLAHRLARGRRKGQPLQAWSRHTYINHVRAFYQWATQAGYLDGDPSLDLARPKAPRPVPRPIRDDHLGRLLAMAPEPIRTAVLLGALAGLRVNEVAGMWREHIEEDYILVVRAKGGGHRTVPTHPDIWAHVAGLPEGPLFVRPDGREADGRWLGQTTRRVRLKLGVPETFHQLRHWAGTTVQREQGDIRITQEFLGHASIASTQIYTQVTPARLRAAVTAALPSLMQTGPASH